MRFIVRFTSSRGRTASSAASAGHDVRVQGWNAGIKVTPREAAGDLDSFDVYMTGGSHDEGTSIKLGTVQDTRGDPVWEPEAKPGKIPTNADGKPVVAAVPMQSHLSKAEPDAYACVVLLRNWAYHEARFGTARMTRDESGAWLVTEHSDYWNGHMSQTGAVTEMVRMAGHERSGPSRVSRG